MDDNDTTQGDSKTVVEKKREFHRARRHPPSRSHYLPPGIQQIIIDYCGARPPLPFASTLTLFKFDNPSDYKEDDLYMTSLGDKLDGMDATARKERPFDLVLYDWLGFKFWLECHLGERDVAIGEFDWEQVNTAPPL